MVKFEDLFEGRKAIAVVGLGYVGLSLAVELGKVFRGIIGFDISEKRVNELSQGIDITEEASAICGSRTQEKTLSKTKEKSNGNS